MQPYLTCSIEMIIHKKIHTCVKFRVQGRMFNPKPHSGIPNCRFNEYIQVFQFLTFQQFVLRAINSPHIEALLIVYRFIILPVTNTISVNRFVASLLINAVDTSLSKMVGL